MRARPVSLSIIGWFLIVTGILGIFGTLMMTNNPVVQRVYAQSPLPISVHVAIGIIGTIITAACGYGVLKGFNWSRLLYVGWSLIGFVIAFVTIPVTSMIILSVAFFALMVFFLFRPAANEWFNETAKAGQ